MSRIKKGEKDIIIKVNGKPTQVPGETAAAPALSEQAGRPSP